MYDYVVICGSFEPFLHEIKRPKMNTSIVFALVSFAIKLMTWLNVFKCEGDEGNIACQVDDVVERAQARGVRRFGGVVRDLSHGLSAGADLLIHDGLRGDLGHLHMAKNIRGVSVLFNLVPVHGNGLIIVPVADLAESGQVRGGDGDHRIIFQESPKGR